MSKLPDGWVEEEPQKLPEGWVVESAPAEDADGVAAGSPLDLARKAAPGQQTYKLDTPTGPVEVDARGNPVVAASDYLGGVNPRARLNVLQGIESLAQGASHGLAGPLAGAVSVNEYLRRKMMGETTARPTAAESFKAGAQEQRTAMNEATASASPKAFGVPVLPVLGDFATSGPIAETALGRIGINAGLGAMRAAGEGESPVSAGATGAAVSVPMEIAGGALGRVASGAANSKAAIRALMESRYAKEVADELASLKGKLGGETQKASRMLENTQRGISGVAPGQTSLPQDIYQRALGQLGEQSSIDLQSKILSRNLEELPRQQAVIQGLEQDVAQKSAQAPQEVASRLEDYFNTPAIKELKPKFERMGQRATLGALGYGVGAAFDEATGSTKGRALGAGVAGAMIAAPGMKQMLNNIAKSPRLQTAAIDASQGLMREGLEAGQSLARSSASNQSTAFDLLSSYLGRPVGSPKDLATQHMLNAEKPGQYQDEVNRQ